MIKRTATYVLVLLASLVYLAHAVIPHHHHSSMLCIEDSHCRNETGGNEQSDAEHDHQHDNKSNTAGCLLVQPIVLPSDKDKIECICTECTQNHFFDGLYALFNHPSEIIIPVFRHVNPNLEINFPYLLYQRNSLGLRAPPTV